MRREFIVVGVSPAKGDHRGAEMHGASIPLSRFRNPPGQPIVAHTIHHAALAEGLDREPSIEPRFAHVRGQPDLLIEHARAEQPKDPPNQFWLPVQADRPTPHDVHSCQYGKWGLEHLEHLLGYALRREASRLKLRQVAQLKNRETCRSGDSRSKEQKARKHYH
jgi:hypothetical protein